MNIKQPSFFLIVGMHRSGTSCLTGSLERCGIFLGNVQRRNKHNKKGNFELKAIYEIHDQILNLNNSSWHQPPQKNIILQTYHEQKLEVFIEELKKKNPTGLKDPRTLLLLDEWKRVLNKDFQLIGSFRHPMAVAQSLEKRNGFSIEKGLQLWYNYNQVMIEEHKKQPFPIIHYDLSNKKIYVDKIITLANLFGLKPQKRKLNWFVSEKLEHHQTYDYELPKHCKKAYDYLLKHSFKSIE
ncbi:MAG: hypothetical protein ACJAT9_000240 [Polaribacter sp.]|jgi:hypothetical protein|tara:strand:- start:2066 stop:2785 length:720 start_codon:yes stop_codon:yes gene_type:complete